MYSAPPPRPPTAQTDVAFIARATRWVLVALFVAVGVLVLLWLLKGALTPLAAAFFLAYLLDPLIDWFEAHGVPRRFTILCLTAVLVLALLTGLFFVIPQLQGDLGALGERLPYYLEQLRDVVIPGLEKRFNVELPSSYRDVIRALSGRITSLPIEAVRSFLAGLLGYVTGTINTLIWLLVIPILAYYLLVDFDRITASVVEWTPPRYRRYLIDKTEQVNHLIAGFLRGQLAVATILGLLYTVGFSVIGIDLSIGVGMLAGALALVPYLGNIAAVTLASSLSVLKFGFDAHLLAVLGWYVLVQNLEGFVLTPRIIGKSVGLSPPTVIVSLLIGGDLFGFLGLLIAVPGAAVVKVFAAELLEMYRQSALFADSDEDG